MDKMFLIKFKLVIFIFLHYLFDNYYDWIILKLNSYFHYILNNYICYSLKHLIKNKSKSVL